MSTFALDQLLEVGDSEDDEDYEPPPASQLEDSDHNTIAKRTRAQLSLGNVTWEELDAILQEMPDENLDQQDPDQDTYLAFLHTLQQDSKQDDEDEDDDFRVEEKLEYDHEEYRADKAVHISSRELTTLLSYSAPSLSRTSVEQAPLLPKLPVSHELGFSPSQMAELHSQFADHVYLLLQILFNSVTRGSDDLVMRRCLGLLTELVVYKEYWNKRPSINSARGTRRKSDMIEMENAILALPGLDESFVNELWQLSVAPVEERAATAATLRPRALGLACLTECTCTKLAVTRSARGRIGFTPAEDELLIIGLQRYGHNAFDTIQRHLLPSKTVQQIANRFKNRTAGKAQWNEMKAYKMAGKVQDPLASKSEIQLLRQGIGLYGYNWSLISAQLLPSRKPSALKRLWKQVVRDVGSNSKRERCNFETEEIYSDEEPEHQQNRTERMWSKEEDRCLLIIVKEMGAQPTTWTNLSTDLLRDRSPEAIEKRYNVLMALFRELTPSSSSVS